MPGIRVHEYSHFSDGEVAAGDRLWPISCVQSDTVYNHKLCWRAHKVILLVPASCHVLHIHTYICIYTYMCIHTYISTHLCILGAKIWQCFYQVIKPSLSEVHHLQDIHALYAVWICYIYIHTHIHCTKQMVATYFAQVDGTRVHPISAVLTEIWRVRVWHSPVGDVVLRLTSFHASHRWRGGGSQVCLAHQFIMAVLHGPL
jgi:hypothetical protein